ncbi:tetratricopeptide repeat protein [Sphingobium sufflavum]|uniref:tetratricopeptide repeat protein n=1 Tax=Sphingobium sufflavum TaxID=1129547 RepID=UPI001F309E9F|nr:tetratricopeptide repeat protein [Sphingobium sufflavum]MCE7798764.1 tetratricopeptide repeat protein [Sphingobium sufflavum]
MRLPIVALPMMALMLLPSAGALAQTSVEGRVGRLEQEMRAVQRKVFPDGAGKYFQPQVTIPTGTVAAPGSPASSPVTDLSGRVSAVEEQLRTLTGQVEQNSFKLRQLEQAFAQYKTDMAASASSAAAAHVLPAVKPAAPVATGKPATPATKPAAGGAAAASGANEVRKAAVAAIERPETGNDADDAYNYGYRLWSAKFLPEAQAQLKATVEKYGTTGVASRAHNLLGRAYLDDGKYALASVAFYDNYQKRPKGDRAADSLTWLGEALIQLKKLPDACKVYQELNDVYGATLRPELKTQAEKGKARAKCSA